MTLNSQSDSINVNIADWKNHADTLQPCHHPAKQVQAEAAPGRCLHTQVSAYPGTTQEQMNET